MNVLSLFDGMSCGQQALDRAGLQVDNYYASEIDPYAIKVTMANYPETIQLGSVVDVDGYALPKIDLLIGGSPCQSFSFAGKRKGMATKCETEILTLEHYLQLKAEGYEFEGQSYLFWEFMRLLYEVKPKYFLLENVEMGEKWEKVLSKAIGVNGIHINSALVSAQNRRRIYWTNIGLEPKGLFGDLESIIKQPKDKGIFLKDILQDNPNSKVYLSDKMINYINKTGTKNFYYKPEYANVEGKSKPITMVHDKRAGTTNYISETIQVDEKYFLSERGIDRIMSYNNADRSIDSSSKALCLASGYSKQGRDNQLIVQNTMPRSSTTGKGGTGHLSRNDGKTYCLDTGNTNAVEIKDIMLGRSASWGMPENGGGESYTLCKEQPHGIKLNSRIRRLTPLECERLQTVADNYTNHVSDTQRYRMIGNGWTVDIIAHIFSYIKDKQT
ncbi:Dcm Site-specific DNA methylase [uncultured Caudovirales phage]|uniref:Dcm Site-specific DNA methylase n=1 Tax=uncultured Caudovirales phage TaxID=2100421 RepID=A0A6J5MRV2_9CAUD|nr:Dcm Site-specific DNA methylase [uncultured Caudovirales phage]